LSAERCESAVDGARNGLHGVCWVLL